MLSLSIFSYVLQFTLQKFVMMQMELLVSVKCSEYSFNGYELNNNKMSKCNVKFNFNLYSFVNRNVSQYCIQIVGFRDPSPTIRIQNKPIVMQLNENV